MKNLDAIKLDETLGLLEARLQMKDSGPLRLVVGGGSALIAVRLITRTTQDVDIVALMDEREQLIDPHPLPPVLLDAASEVAQILGLSEGWLNDAPSRGEGGLFQMGLPEGFVSRLFRKDYGRLLTVYFAGREDQIHFKLDAAVDRGGYHIADLLSLNPDEDELTCAARWAMTHDVSPGFREAIKTLLKELGYGQAAKDI
jgi:hypothetical protein